MDLDTVSSQYTFDDFVTDLLFPTDCILPLANYQTDLLYYTTFASDETFITYPTIGTVA